MSKKHDIPQTFIDFYDNATIPQLMKLKEEAQKTMIDQPDLLNFVMETADRFIQIKN